MKKFCLMCMMSFCLLLGCVSNMDCIDGNSEEEIDKVVQQFTTNLSQRLGKTKYYATVTYSGTRLYDCDFEQDMFLKKMRSELVKKNVVYVTNIKGEPMINEARKELRYSAEMDQRNVPKKGELIPPQLNINCGITRNGRELLFSIMVTRLSDGILLWSDDIIVVN